MIINNNTITAVRLEEWNNEDCMKISEIQCHLSTDNGVTWTASSFPIGTLAAQTMVMCDANRFYLGVLDQSQVLTSSDGVTWTIVTLTQNFNIHAQSGFTGPGLVTFDSNTVAMIGYNNSSGYSQFMSTTDGGVTWTMGQFLVSNNGGNWKGGNVYLTPDGGGIAFQTGQSLSDSNGPKVFKSDLTAGGAFYRTGVTTITPLRTNAKAYVRVG
jgi:hypothetical protein